jgi:hypothetical protein
VIFVGEDLVVDRIQCWEALASVLVAGPSARGWERAKQVPRGFPSFMPTEIHGGF